MVEVVKRRPDVGGDVLTAILGLPADMVPVSAAIHIAAIGAIPSHRDAAKAALESLSQTSNKAVKAAAEGRLRALSESAATGRGR
jgi:hypothetical protein